MSRIQLNRFYSSAHRPALPPVPPHAPGVHSRGGAVQGGGHGAAHVPGAAGGCSRQLLRKLAVSAGRPYVLPGPPEVGVVRDTGVQETTSSTRSSSPNTPTFHASTDTPPAPRSTTRTGLRGADFCLRYRTQPTAPCIVANPHASSAPRSTLRTGLRGAGLCIRRRVRPAAPR